MKLNLIVKSELRTYVDESLRVGFKPFRLAFKPLECQVGLIQDYSLQLASALGWAPIPFHNAHRFGPMDEPLCDRHSGVLLANVTCVDIVINRWQNMLCLIIC